MFIIKAINWSYVLTVLELNAWRFWINGEHSTSRAKHWNFACAPPANPNWTTIPCYCGYCSPATTIGRLQMKEVNNYQTKLIEILTEFAMKRFASDNIFRDWNSLVDTNDSCFAVSPYLWHKSFLFLYSFFSFPNSANAPPLWLPVPLFFEASFTRVRTNFCTDKNLHGSTLRLHGTGGTGRIFERLSVLFWDLEKASPKLAHLAVQIFAQFRRSRVNARWNRASFCPCKNLSGPV